MKATFLNTLDAARRVQSFFDAHASVINGGKPAPWREELDAAVQQLDAYQTEQGRAIGMAHGETAALKRLREDLYANFGSPIRSVVNARLRHVEEYWTLLLPSRPDRHGDYLAMAVGLIESATKHEQLLINHLLPKDFIAQMQDIVAQISATMASRARHWSRRSAATDGIEAAERTVRKILVSLDCVLVPLLPNPGLVADWKSSRRIRKTTVNPLSTGGVIDAKDESSSTP